AGSAVEAVERARGLAVELLLLRGTRTFRDALEDVPQRLIAARRAVHRKIALQHAAGGAEDRNAGLEIGPPGVRKLLRAGKRLAPVELEAAALHAEPAKLHMDIRAGGQFLDVARPARKDLVAPSGIGADADRPADVIEHDLRFRH